MNDLDLIVGLVLEHYPSVQAVYLYGTWGTAGEGPDSDVDIALLLSPREARDAGSLALSDLRFGLEAALNREVDLINLRRVPTVLQKEVVAADRRIHAGDDDAAGVFEMLVLSYYQKLNEERREILDAFYESRRAYIKSWTSRSFDLSSCRTSTTWYCLATMFWTWSGALAREVPGLSLLGHQVRRCLLHHPIITGGARTRLARAALVKKGGLGYNGPTWAAGRGLAGSWRTGWRQKRRFRR